LIHDSGLAGAADGIARQLAVLASDFEGLPLLAFGAGFVGAVGDANPAAGEILGGERAAEQEEDYPEFM
jgi:hypothetical protein